MSVGFSRINEIPAVIDRRYRSDSLPLNYLLRLCAALSAGGCRRRGNGPGDELGAAALRACGRQHDVLIAPMHVGHRQRRLRARGQFGLPEVLTGLLVVGMEYGLSVRTFAREQEVPGDEQSGLRRAARRRNVGQTRGSK